ncbi:hypothetical protein [Maridesulfovibrio frigidus]|uniref:hypothetical protein n=1 Tax=Maridesulfovibrio frigidus TaxID=340956 RepID=UPI0004E21035|nr:hypothetical protein [Maridesulfovibrio frigidus]
MKIDIAIEKVLRDESADLKVFCTKRNDGTFTDGTTISRELDGNFENYVLGEGWVTDYTVMTDL